MTTAIQWTDETWNPVVGCTKVSQGCKNCYAKTLHDQRHKASLAGKAVAPQYAAPFEVVQLMPDRLEDPLRWRKPRRVFVNSVSDLFHEDIPADYTAQVFAIMALAQRHTFQVLTKRPERMREILTDPLFREEVAPYVSHYAIENSDPHDRRRDDLRATAPDVEGDDWPLSNVHLGTSTEDQPNLDKRLPHLMATPAAVRFLSAEPLLGPIEIDFDDIASRDWEGRQLDWVIVGGESGPKARVCHVQWIRELVAECGLAGVPVFVKQLGKWIEGDHREYGFLEMRWLLDDHESVWVPPLIGDMFRARPRNAIAFGLADDKGGNPLQWPMDLRVRQFPGEVPA